VRLCKFEKLQCEFDLRSVHEFADYCWKTGGALKSHSAFTSTSHLKHPKKYGPRAPSKHDFASHNFESARITF
jgi:hypothetical protein